MNAAAGLIFGLVFAMMGIIIVITVVDVRQTWDIENRYGSVERFRQLDCISKGGQVNQWHGPLGGWECVGVKP